MLLRLETYFIIVWSIVSYLVFQLLKQLPFWKEQFLNRNEQVNLNQLKQSLQSKNSNRVLWYCSSAGEFEQAKPAMDLLEKYGFTSIVLFHSVSGVQFLNAKSDNSVCYGLAPVDNLWIWQKWFAELSPKAVVVVRHELWPAFIVTARKHCPLYIIGLTEQGRRSFPAALVRAWLLRKFRIVGVVTKEDEDLVKALSPNIRTEVLGDAKFDRAWEHAQTSSTANPEIVDAIKDFSQGRQILMIGSAWPEDVDFVLQSWLLLDRTLQSKWCMIFVPHEIDRDSLNLVESIHEKHKVSNIALNKISEQASSLTIARMGQLSKIYNFATIAWVGGSVNRKVHNVVEPLAHGCAIAFGSRFHNSPEAESLVRASIAFTAQKPKDFAEWWKLIDQGHHKELKEKQRLFIHQNLGATTRIVALIKPTENP